MPWLAGLMPGPCQFEQKSDYKSENETHFFLKNCRMDERLIKKYEKMKSS